MSTHYRLLWCALFITTLIICGFSAGKRKYEELQDEPDRKKPKRNVAPGILSNDTMGDIEAYPGRIETEKLIRLKFEVYKVPDWKPEYTLYAIDLNDGSVETQWTDKKNASHRLEKQDADLILRQYQELFRAYQSYGTIGAWIGSYEVDDKKQKTAPKAKVAKEKDEVMCQLLAAVEEDLFKMWLPQAIVSRGVDIAKVKKWFTSSSKRWITIDISIPKNQNNDDGVRPVGKHAPMNTVKTARIFQTHTLYPTFQAFPESQKPSKRRRLMEEQFSGSLIFNHWFAVIATVVFTLTAVLTSFFYYIV